MVYIYRRAASESARELAEAIPINCRKLNDLGKAHYGTGVRAGDVVVCWGEHLAPINGVRILNGGPIRYKYDDAVRLREAGVATVEVSRTRPAPLPPQLPPPDPAGQVWLEAVEAAQDFVALRAFDRNRPYTDGVRTLQGAIEALGRALLVPAPVTPVVRK